MLLRRRQMTLADIRQPYCLRHAAFDIFVPLCAFFMPGAHAVLLLLSIRPRRKPRPPVGTARLHRSPPACCRLLAVCYAQQALPVCLRREFAEIADKWQAEAKRMSE